MSQVNKYLMRNISNIADNNNKNLINININFLVRYKHLTNVMLFDEWHHIIYLKTVYFFSFHGLDNVLYYISIKSSNVFVKMSFIIRSLLRHY